MRGFTFKKRRLQNKSSGFTIIELMIVVGVITILLGTAALNFDTIVFGSYANRMIDTLVGDLHLARITAMRAKRTVTVAFDQPTAGQYTISYNGQNGLRTEVHSINLRGSRLIFDNNPPGSSPAPDTSFLFNSLGFAQPGSGNLIGNIYVSDSENGNIFRIATTPAGGIEKRRWLGDAWEGTPLTYTPGP